jgi:hypothetical protein
VNAAPQSYEGRGARECARSNKQTGGRKKATMTEEPKEPDYTVTINERDGKFIVAEGGREVSRLFDDRKEAEAWARHLQLFYQPLCIVCGSAISRPDDPWEVVQSSTQTGFDYAHRSCAIAAFGEDSVSGATNDVKVDPPFGLDWESLRSEILRLDAHALDTVLTVIFGRLLTASDPRHRHHAGGPVAANSRCLAADHRHAFAPCARRL